MKLIGYMSVHNGAEFIREAILSTIHYCDKYIVIEGAWGENIMVNGKPRSDDGTIEILKELSNKFDHLEVYHVNETDQLKQRTKVFDCIKENEDYWLWLIDHDEVYDENNIRIMKSLLEHSRAQCLKINSFTFVNDFDHYVEIAWPRLFRIQPQKYEYIFCAPNHLQKITSDGVSTLPIDSIEDKVFYFHYSYCHSAKRFMEKRKERMFLHGEFKWYLDEDNNVVAPGTNIRKFDSAHPDIMLQHPLYRRTKQ